MHAKSRGHQARSPLRPLSKREIDRQIEEVLADLGAAIDAVASRGGEGPDDPLRPRRIPPGALTGRMRRFVADN
jgi:hypothetical protein